MKIKGKKFNHNFLPKQLDLTRVDGEPGGRYYLLEGSTDRFYSVTNILSTMIKSKALEKWKKDLGDKAVEITKKAADRGMALHTLCEQYLLNEEVEGDPFERNFEIFRRVKEVLDRDVEDILAIELPLFSKRLLVAGTPDVIASFRKKLSIIDFKTIKSSSKIKPERILKYFLQGVFYSIMVEELYGIKIKQVVLIFGTETDDEATILRLGIKKKDIERVTELSERFRQQLKQGFG